MRVVLSISISEIQFPRDESLSISLGFTRGVGHDGTHRYSWGCLLVHDVQVYMMKVDSAVFRFKFYACLYTVVLSSFSHSRCFDDEKWAALSTCNS